jgi:hypothetical protein
LVLDAAKSVLGRFGIRHVHIGDTDYGITKQIDVPRWEIEPVTGCPADDYPSGYSDARAQFRVISLDNRKEVKDDY